MARCGLGCGAVVLLGHGHCLAQGGRCWRGLRAPSHEPVSTVSSHLSVRSVVVWLDVHPNSPHRCHGAPRPHPGATGTVLQDTGMWSLTLCTHQRVGPVLPGCQSPSAGPGAPMQCPGPLARCCNSPRVSAALLLLPACSHLPRVHRVSRSSASLVINMMMMMIITLIFCFAFACHASGSTAPGP